MRCPLCNFTQIDRNDICVKCYADMRPAKLKVGIPVEHPDIKYADLQKLLLTPQKEATNPKKDAKPLESQNKQTEVSKPSEISNTNVNKLETKPQNQTPKVEVPKKVPEKAPLSNKESFFKVNEIIPKIEEPNPTKQIALQKFYENCFTEIEKNNIDFSVELFDLIGNTQTEKINVLYETAIEEILDPNKSLRISESKQKKVVQIESKELIKQLKKVVETFENPSLLLKNIKAKDLSNRKKAFVLENVSLQKRALSFILDCAICLVFSFVLSQSLRLIFDSEFNSRLFSFSTNHNDLRFFILGTLMSLPFTLTIYSIFTYLLVGTTIGELSIRSQVVKKNGELPTFFELLVKALCLPINFTFIGMIFTLLKKYSLTDYFADSFLHQLGEVVEE